jgi:hypothetical protein
MAHQVNSHDFRPVYDHLGIDLSALGCVMLEIAPMPIRETLGEELESTLFWSPDPKKFWIKGPVAQEGGHVTLLYGILKHLWTERNATTSADRYFGAIEDVLGDWQQPSTVIIDEVLAWPDPAGGPSTTIVGSIRVDPALLDAHQRLSLLPHVDTFLDYHPHVTLAYVKNDRAIEAYDLLANRFQAARLNTTDLDYGHPA